MEGGMVPLSSWIVPHPFPDGLESHPCRLRLNPVPFGTDPNEQRNRRGAGAAMLSQYGEGVFNPFAQAERTHFPILREGVGNTLLHIVVGEHQQRDKVVVRPLLILIVARRLSYAAPMDIVSVNDLAASVRQARPIPSHRVGQSDRPPVFLMHQPQTALMRGKCGNRPQ